MSSFRDSFRDSNGGAYLLFFSSFLFFNIVGIAFLKPLGFHLSTIVTEIVGILGAAVLWRLALGDAAAKWPSLRPKISPAGLVVALATAVALGFLANILASLFVELSPALQKMAEAYSKEISKLIVNAHGLDWVLGVIGVCVAAPICEESLFRGTILQEQRKQESVATAVIVNGLMFSAFHVNPVSFVGLALVGMFLAHLTIRTGSIIPSILAHASLNTANAVVLPALYPEAAQTTQEAAPIGDLLVTGGALVLICAFLWWATVHLTKKTAGD